MPPVPKRTILLQLDTDPQPSVFDGVVAVDSGVEVLFRQGGVTPTNVRDLVHGLLFTRGASDLSRSAIFVGGSDVASAEAVLKGVTSAFFGAFRVSVLFDANGSNTTAAAAVLAALEGLELGPNASLKGVHTAVLAATGPVGQRVARLLAHLGATVAVGSRGLARARGVAEALRAAKGDVFHPFASDTPEALVAGIAGAAVVVSAGAAGVTLLPESVRTASRGFKVVIDLNAVPPVGIEGVEATDRKANRQGILAWGALGIGGRKMKIHKKALEIVFTSNDQVLDAEGVLEIGRALS